MIRFVGSMLCCLVVSLAFASEPMVVFEGKDAAAPKQPQAFVGSDGVVHVTFGVGNDVYYCNLAGDKCSLPKVACQIPNMALGMRRGPRIASSGSSIVITAIGGAQGKGKDEDILCYRSEDHGASWIGPVKVNDVDGSAREGLHAMTASSDGTLWCVWLDLRDRGTKLFVSKSADHGATWSKNALAYRSPSGSVCECCHPSILATDDSLHILFRNSLKGDRDMYLVSSSDRGETFGPAVRLGEKNWTLNACPMDGGMVAIDNRGELRTAWRRNQSVFATGPNDGLEALLGPGEQPWIAGAEGFYTVWTTKRDGDLMLHKPGASTSEKLDENSSYPVVVSGGKANAGVYVFWEKRNQQSYKLLGKRVGD